MRETDFFFSSVFNAWKFSQTSALSLSYFGKLAAKEMIRAHEIAVSIRNWFLFLRSSPWRTLVCVCNVCVPVLHVFL